MVKTKKLLKFIEKYSINKEILVLNIDNYRYLNKLIDKNYKISVIKKEANLRIYNYTSVIADDIFNIHNLNKRYEISVINDLFEYKSDKDINKIMKVAINNSECLIFDAAISNYFCDLDHNDIRYLNTDYWYSLFKKYNLVIIEEYSYRINIFERHKIFVVRKKEDK